MSSVKLFAGTNSHTLAEKIADEYDQKLGDLSLSRFSDGEMQPVINESVRGDFVFFIQSTDAPLTWELYAIDGKRMQTGAMKGKTDVLDAKDLPNGLYFLKVSEAGQLRTTLKIAIMK